jgi:hypothetical protein
MGRLARNAPTNNELHLLLVSTLMLTCVCHMAGNGFGLARTSSPLEGGSRFGGASFNPPHLTFHAANGDAGQVAAIVDGIGGRPI